MKCNQLDLQWQHYSQHHFHQMYKRDCRLSQQLYKIFHWLEKVHTVCSHFALIAEYFVNFFFFYLQFLKENLYSNIFRRARRDWELAPLQLEGGSGAQGHLERRQQAHKNLSSIQRNVCTFVHSGSQTKTLWLQSASRSKWATAAPMPSRQVHGQCVGALGEGFHFLTALPESSVVLTL